jgi:flagellar hook protein FlgE
MSLYSSFYSSLSGLSANSGMLGVIGNNLSNLNTVGFKGSSSNFQDLFNASLGSNGTSGNGNPMQVGLGTQLGSITQDFSQGSFQSTGTVTNMAVSGQGFFLLRRSDGSQVYTRAGNFSIDRNGYLVNANGDQVLGWNRIGTTLSTNGTVVPIQVNSGTVSPPTTTANITTTTNLNANANNGTTFSTPVQVYDSLGAAHTVLITYTKRAVAGTDPAGTASAWDVTATSGDSTNAGGAIPLSITSVTFNNSGVLTTPASGTNPTLTGENWSNGAASSTINWNIWSTGATPVSSLTGYAAASATSGTTQDGATSGTISSLVVDQNGIITGNFTNGQTIQLSQVALATFPNMNGLSKDGNNSWAQTLSSGAPNVGAADQGGRGKVLGGQLELSNVDTATEFTQLIVAQRGYQANSRIVTTADTLLQEVLNLVR